MWREEQSVKDDGDVDNSCIFIVTLTGQSALQCSDGTNKKDTRQRPPNQG